MNMIASNTAGKILTNNAIRVKRPLIVEIAGLAGAGKTTLAKALSQTHENILISPVPRLRKTRDVPLFISQAWLLLPIFLRQGPGSRWLTWREIKMMLHLNGWKHILSRPAVRKEAVILLDHGPVYRLATLHEFGPAVTRSRRFRQWSDRMLNRWAATLDLVVWLDAPNPVLVERINNRDSRHIVKGKPEPEMNDFLTRYRTSYEQVISRLMARNHSPRLLRCETGQETPDQVINRVLNAIEMHLRDMDN